MNRTPLSWRLFIVFNYLLLLCFTLIFVSLCFFLGNNRVEPEERITFIPFFAASFFILFNCVCTIIHYHRFYPNKPLPRKTAIFLFIHTFFYLLSIVDLLLIIVLGIREEIIAGGNDSSGLTLLGILFLAGCICIYTFIFQIRLAKTIRTNYRTQLENLIEKIGEKEMK